MTWAERPGAPTPLVTDEQDCPANEWPAAFGFEGLQTDCLSPLRSGTRSQATPTCSTTLATRTSGRGHSPPAVCARKVCLKTRGGGDPQQRVLLRWDFWTVLHSPCR